MSSLGKSLLYAATALAVLTTGAKADVILFAPAPGGQFVTAGNLPTPNNPQTYTSGGLSVSASGFLGNNMMGALFEKNLGGSETGLGLVGTTDNEINSPSQFIQFQFLSIPTNLNLAMSFLAGSTTNGEGWEVFGTNTANTVAGATLLASCTSPAVGSGACETLTNIAGALGFKFVDVVATNGNMLVREINAVPLPGALGLFGTGLGLISLLASRRKRKLA
jgi:hypothetical protein